MRLLFLFSILLFAVSVSAETPPVPEGTSASQEMPRVVMARVGSHEITVEEFMQFLAKNPTRVQEATTVDGKAQLLRDLIETHLLMQAMRAEGLLNAETQPTDEELKKAFMNLGQKHFPPPPAPNVEAQRTYYAANQSDFGIPAVVRLSQIQFRVKESATPEEIANTKQRAEEALKRIESGEPFDKVASELTENTRYRSTGGDVGYLRRHGNEWLDKALNGLKVGEHTSVLESPVGYDILMLTDEREAITTPFEEARESVIKQMQVEAQKTAKTDYVKELAAQTQIEIVLEELNSASPDGVFPQSTR